MHNVWTTVDQKPRALRARMRMMNSRPFFALAIAGTLSACGPAIDEGETGETNEQTETIEGTEAIEQTETIEETETSEGTIQQTDVANLDVGCIYYPGYVTAIRFGGFTRWNADRVHTVEVQVRLHKHHPGGTWGAVSPFYTKRSGNSLVNHQPTVRCVSGEYKAETKGRVLFSGGWSPFEFRVSSPYNIYCE